LPKLADVLTTVDWNKIVTDSVAKSAFIGPATNCCKKISLFTHELIFQDAGNPATPFLQEMKASAFQVPACLALGLAKPAAGLMRSSVENALYYSYFRSHPSELRTLVVDEKFYLSRKSIVDYHLKHTPDFSTRAEKLGLIDALDNWYGSISAIVHGQIPGVWSSKSLSDTASLGNDIRRAIRVFEQATKLIQAILLSTVPSQDWDGINPLNRKRLLSGLTAKDKRVLDLPLV
jgi:hypothetical protein